MRGRVMAVIVAAAATLALAGCSSGSDEGGGNNGSSPASAAVEQVPVNLTTDPQNTTVPVTLPSPRPLAAIPDAYRGRWGQVAGDCESGRADAKGLMTVAATTLRFYEARARVEQLALTLPGQLTARLAYTGEGQQWRHNATLTVQDDGKTLIRDEQGDAQGNPSGIATYHRCPG